MYAVGIDVSKGKSTVSVFDQRKEMVVKPIDIPHTLTGLAALSELVRAQPGEVKVVMEWSVPAVTTSRSQTTSSRMATSSAPSIRLRSGMPETASVSMKSKRTRQIPKKPRNLGLTIEKTRKRHSLFAFNEYTKQVFRNRSTLSRHLRMKNKP